MSSLKYVHGSGEDLPIEFSSVSPKIANGIHHLKSKTSKIINASNGTTNGHTNGHANGAQECISKVGNVVNPYTYEIIKESADYILSQTSHRPRIGIICGSGLGPIADLLENKDEFPYEKIPHFPQSTVQGHAGKLVIGELGSLPVLCMKGRFHFYEGYPLWKVAMPVRVFKLLGIEILIVTNAAGGLNPAYKVGDVMLIKDHLNFPGMGGDSPLRGPNDDRFGTRFPALNNCYDPKFRELAKQIGNELGMSDFMREGVYTMVGGPNFETVAELRAMRTLGIDAVGMSTIPEVILARHCGIRCFAFSLITNECVTEYDAEDEGATHEEVQETANQRENDLKLFVMKLIPSLHDLHMEDKAKEARRSRDNSL